MEFIINAAQLLGGIILLAGMAWLGLFMHQTKFLKTKKNRMQKKICKFFCLST